MRLTRDSIILWITMIGGVLTALAANVGVFPTEWQGYIQSAATIVAAISGWMKTSPLPGEKD